MRSLTPCYWFSEDSFCCLYVALRLVKNVLEGATTLVISLFGAFVYSHHEGHEHALWLPLIVVMGGTVVALTLVILRPRVNGNLLEEDQWS